MTAAEAIGWAACCSLSLPTIPALMPERNGERIETPSLKKAEAEALGSSSPPPRDLVAALALFAVDESEAFGFSLVFHLSQFVFLTLTGWLLLLREQMALSDLTTIKRPGEKENPV